MKLKEPTPDEVEQHAQEVRNSLNEAIGQSELNSKRHRRFALLWLIGSITIICAALLGSSWFAHFVTATRTWGEQSKTGDLITAAKQTEYATYLSIAFAIAVAVTMFGMYRYHMGQAVRNEHMELGFRRIRIAARNSSAGFETEVRRSLTENAFVFDDGKGSKKEVIENPMPGHPASDLMTQLFNQLLERVEIDVRPKTKP